MLVLCVQLNLGSKVKLLGRGGFNKEGTWAFHSLWKEEKNSVLCTGESKAGWLGTTLKIDFIAFLIMRVIYIPCRKIGKYKNINGIK